MTTLVERERASGLWEWWDLLCRSFDADLDAAARWGADLRSRHAEPHRHYHNAGHLVAVLEALEVLEEHDPTTAFAAFFHDAIYDPRAQDNETRSAELARRALDELQMNLDGALACACIEATARHEPAAPPGRDRAIVSAFLDADLSILGAQPATYDAYAQAIRDEYSHVPDDAYRHARSAVLSGFSERPEIFFTDRAAERWESQARANLSRELAQLAV